MENLDTVLWLCDRKMVCSVLEHATCGVPVNTRISRRELQWLLGPGVWEKMQSSHPHRGTSEREPQGTSTCKGCVEDEDTRKKQPEVKSLSACCHGRQGNFSKTRVGTLGYRSVPHIFSKSISFKPPDKLLGWGTSSYNFGRGNGRPEREDKYPKVRQGSGR